MKQITLALLILWILSVHFYLYVPAVIAVLLGAGFVSVASVTALDWLSHRLETWERVSAD